MNFSIRKIIFLIMYQLKTRPIQKSLSLNNIKYFILVHYTKMNKSVKCLILDIFLIY